VSQPLPFLFDTEFGAPRVRKPDVPMVTLAEHEATVATVRGEAQRQGFAEGQRSVEAEAARRQAMAFERIGDAVARLANGLETVEQRLEQEAVDVAVATAQRLAPALVAREPLAEIEALARECFATQRTMPHVVVRVHEALFPAALDNLTRIARERGFEGRLVVLGDPDIATGDARIEWADGGVTRESASVVAEIDKLVARYLGSRAGEPSDFPA
jgi:flagellar assembly protein FliH